MRSSWAAGSSASRRPTRSRGAAPTSSCSSAACRATGSRRAPRAASATCTRRAEQIADAVRARALWDAWSVARRASALVGPEGALRLGGDVAGDAARLRAAGVAATVVEHAGALHPALAADAGPLLWDPRGGAIRAAAAIAWLRARARRPPAARRGHGGRRRAGVETRRRPARLRHGRGLRRRGHRAARARRRDAPRRPPARHVRAPRAAAARRGRASWGAATWADRSGAFGARTYGVADGPGRFALGLAELDAQPAPEDPAADAVPAGIDLDRRARAAARLRAPPRSPASAPPVDEVVRLLTVLPGDDEDAYVLDRRPGLIVVAGHNLFKLAPLLGEKIARRNHVTSLTLIFRKRANLSRAH